MKLEKVKGALCSLKDKVNLKIMAAPVVGAAIAASSAVTAFAEETTGTTFPTVSITNEMLTPLVQGVVDNISAILPVGLGLFAIFLGIRIIPGLLSRFARM